MPEKFLNDPKKLNSDSKSEKAIKNTKNKLANNLDIRYSGIVGYLRIVLQREPTKEEVNLIKYNVHILINAFQKGNIIDLLNDLLSNSSMSIILKEERYLILLEKVLLNYFIEV